MLIALGNIGKEEVMRDRIIEQLEKADKELREAIKVSHTRLNNWDMDNYSAARRLVQEAISKVLYVN